MRIEAAVLRDRSGPFTLEKLELPEPGPGEVLVGVAGVGFCHTDLLPRLPGFALALRRGRRGRRRPGGLPAGG